MSKLIRNYQFGKRIILSDWARQHGTANLENSPEGVQQSAEQMLREAEYLRQQAADQVAEAEQCAAAIVQAAQESAATLQAEAQARGYEEGYQQGIIDGCKKGEASLRDSVSQVQSMLSDLCLQRSQLLAGATDEVAALSMAIAETIVGDLVQNHQQAIVHTVNRALAKLTDAGPLVLRVHPDDRLFLEKFWQKPATEDAAEWKLVSDPLAERGGCILTCGPTTVDARIATQLRALVEGLALTNYVIAADEQPAARTPHESAVSE